MDEGFIRNTRRPPRRGTSSPPGKRFPETSQMREALALSKHNRRPQAPVVPFPRKFVASGTSVEHADRTAVLRPAGNVVADRDRPLLAVGDRAHALTLHAARGEVVSHRLGATGAERDVVLARAALVGVAFDQEGVLR